MQDEYSNAMNFCHGDIYRNIVAARRTGDEALEGRWLGRLNPSLRKDLILFFKKEGYQSLRLALNSLLPFVGLWPSLKLGCLRRIFHLHQPEELAHYLETVREIWSSILLNRDDLFAHLDYDTVRILQLRNLSRYKADLVYVKAKMESGTVFVGIEDESIRSAIMEKLLAIKVCIPSIETFHEDTKWLEPCSAAIREHILPKSSLSLFRGLSRTFDYTLPPSNDENHMDTDKRNRFTLAYRKLFAFAWRYFPELTGISPKQNQGGPKQLSKSYNNLVQHEFRRYAAELGFKNNSVSDICNSEKIMIRRFLSDIRPPDLFRLNQQVEEDLISKIHNIIRDSYQKCGVETHTVCQESSLDNRCGRPSFEVWNAARMFFDYKNIYDYDKNRGAFFADQRDIFILFFGKQNGILPSRDAAESVIFPARTADLRAIDLTDNLLDTGITDEAFQIQAQSATDYYADSSNVSPASPSLSNRNIVPDEATRKRRREDGQPLEKKPRLDFKSTWFEDVLTNAQRIEKTSSTASSSSHLIVFNVREDEFDIWDRNKLQDLFEANPEYSFYTETQQVSMEGTAWSLQSISRSTITNKQPPRSRRLGGANLLFMYKNAPEYKHEHDEFLTRHKENNTQYWKHILELSTKSQSYMSTL